MSWPSISNETLAGKLADLLEADVALSDEQRDAVTEAMFRLDELGDEETEDA